MTVSTVESWNVVHSDEVRQNLNNKMMEMFKAGKLVATSRKTAFGVTVPTLPIGIFANTEVDGNVVTTSVTYTWSNTDAANEYLSFISNLSPASASIVS